MRGHLKALGLFGIRSSGVVGRRVGIPAWSGSTKSPIRVGGRGGSGSGATRLGQVITIDVIPRIGSFVIRVSRDSRGLSGVLSSGGRHGGLSTG